MCAVMLVTRIGIVLVVTVCCDSTLIDRLQIFGIPKHDEDANDATNRACFKYIVDHVIKKHSECSTSTNTVSLSRYLNGLTSVQQNQILKLLKNRLALNKASQLKLKCRLHRHPHHGRTKRGTTVSCSKLINNTGHKLLTECEASVVKMSPTCKGLMCNLTADSFFTDSTTQLRKKMTWNQVATLIKSINGSINGSCPTASGAEDCVEEVYSAATTCFNHTYHAREVGLQLSQRKEINHGLALIKEIHKAFCDDSDCVSSMVKILNTIHNYAATKGTNCAETDKMKDRDCGFLDNLSGHWDHLATADLTGIGDHCAIRILNKTNTIATEIKIKGKYHHVKDDGVNNPLIKIRADEEYSMICKLLLHYHFKANTFQHATSTLNRMKFIKNMCGAADDTDIDLITYHTKQTISWTKAQPLHVQVSRQNTDLQYNDSDQF